MNVVQNIFPASLLR